MFEFKQFRIKQECTAMKVGTDGVLLGAWAAIDSSTQRILDIGSGTGVVALMLAQRSEQYGAQVVGVEIDIDATEESRENIAESPWAECVEIFNGAIQEFRSDLKFDLIVSNPPFFRSSLKSPDAKRNCARHSDTLQLSDLASAAKANLRVGGVLALVLPLEESRQFDMVSCGELYLHRRCLVATRAGGVAKRVLSEYRLEPPEGVIANEELQIYDGVEYSADYVALTRDFYIKF